MQRRPVLQNGVLIVRIMGLFKPTISSQVSTSMRTSASTEEPKFSDGEKD
jgi:hypothetical protein